MALPHNRKNSFQIADILSSQSNRYEIQKFLGQGTYGKVVHCKKLDNSEKVAVKILQKTHSFVGRKELAILKKLKVLDESKNNLVKFIEDFIYEGHFCLVFEMLDITLHEFMKKRSYTPLCVSEIRVITQQMLVALNALKGIGVTHGDIKLDNIMLVNHTAQPFKLKLIDFGLACQNSTIREGTKLQALGYRAPEVILGLPFNEAIDMWSLGCVLAFIYLGRHLYRARCEYECIRNVVKMLGQPDDHMINLGIYSREYFIADCNCSSISWRLKTQTEHNNSTGCNSKESLDKFASLDDIATCQGQKSETESEDIRAFISLLKALLHLNPEGRITPSEALEHHFITMKHLSHDADNDYVESSILAIQICKVEQSLCDFSTSSEAASSKKDSSNLDGPLSFDWKSKRQRHH